MKSTDAQVDIYFAEIYECERPGAHEATGALNRVLIALAAERYGIELDLDVEPLSAKELIDIFFVMVPDGDPIALRRELLARLRRADRVAEAWCRRAGAGVPSDEYGCAVVEQEPRDGMIDLMASGKHLLPTLRDWRVEILVGDPVPVAVAETVVGWIDLAEATGAPDPATMSYGRRSEGRA